MSHGYLRINMDFDILYYLRNPQNLRENFCPTDPTDKHRFLSYSIICEICVRIVFVTQMTQMTQII